MQKERWNRRFDNWRVGELHDHDNPAVPIMPGPLKLINSRDARYRAFRRKKYFSPVDRAAINDIRSMNTLSYYHEIQQFRTQTSINIKTHLQTGTIWPNQGSEIMPIMFYQDDTGRSEARRMLPASGRGSVVSIRLRGHLRNLVTEAVGQPVRLIVVWAQYCFNKITFKDVLSKDVGSSDVTSDSIWIAGDGSTDAVAQPPMRVLYDKTIYVSRSSNTENSTALPGPMGFIVKLNFAIGELPFEFQHVGDDNWDGEVPEYGGLGFIILGKTGGGEDDWAFDYHVGVGLLAEDRYKTFGYSK